MGCVKKLANDQASTPASQHGTKPSTSYQRTRTAPKPKLLENQTKAPATSAAIVTPEKGKRKANTTSREDETTSTKLQPPTKDKIVLDTKSSPLHSSRATSTKTQDLTSSTSAVASKLVPPHDEASTTPVLSIIVFDSDKCGKPGLGLKKKETFIGRVYPFLDPHGKGKTQFIQNACGGMRVVVSRADNGFITQGVDNDKRTLKRHQLG